MPPPNTPFEQEERARYQQQQAALEAEKTKAAKAKKSGKQPAAQTKGKQSQKSKTATGKPAKGKSSGKKKSGKAANPAKRRRQRRLGALVAIVVLIVAGAWFSVSVLFKINKYEVKGDNPYSNDEIVTAFGHAVGDNLYGFSVKNAEERVRTTLPYIETVIVRRRPPSTVVFQVVQAQEAFYFENADGFVILSTTRKVLRVAEEPPPGLIRIDGLTHLSVVPGYPLALSEEAENAAKLAAEGGSSSGAGASSLAEASSVPEEAPSSSVASQPEETPLAAGEGEGDASSMLEANTPVPDPIPVPDPPSPARAAESFAMLELLMGELEKTGLEGIDWIDVSDPLMLRFGWAGRVTVNLGARTGLDEKLAATVVLLTNDEQGIGPDARGTLDMSFYIVTRQSYFSAE